MKTAIRRVPTALALVSLALATLALAAGGAHAAVGYTHESYEEFERQLQAKQVRQVTVNKRLRTLRITLADGRHMLTRYGRHEEPRVVSKLKKDHVPVSILTETQAKSEQGKIPVHHKLRYIVGGVGIAVVAIVGGVLLYNRRRRQRAEVGG